MLAFFSPYYFAASLVIPLIWWLHRLQSEGRTTIVSSLLYWQANKHEMDFSKQGQKNHPLWLLRALISLLLISALAEPFWITGSVLKIDIWVDDSLSMSAIENGGDRKELAINAMLKQLKGLGHIQVKVHSLFQQDYPILFLKGETVEQWAKQLNDWYKIKNEPDELPLAVQFLKDNEHWLLTDGANKKLVDWPARALFHKIIQVGENTENSVISLFALRPDLIKPNIWNGLVKLQHFAEKPSQRKVELVSGSKILKQWTVNLIPEQIHFIHFDIDLASFARNQLVVRFVDADALIADDQIKLELVSHIAVKIIGSCPSALTEAIQSHPSLILLKKADDDFALTVICGDNTEDVAGPRIVFHPVRQAVQLEHAPVWRSNAKGLAQLHLQQHWLSYKPAIEQNSKQAEAVLASSKATLLTLLESDGRRIDSYLDMAATNFISRPEYPVFVASLIDLALDREVLNHIQSVERDSVQSQIKPLIFNLAVKELKTPEYSKQTSLIPPLIIVIILLFILDYLISVKQLLPMRKVG